MIYSASAVTAEHQYGRSYIFLLRQAAWLVIGLFGMFALMRTDYRKLREPAVVYTVVCLVLLMLVGTFFLDKSHAMHRWIKLGPVNIQPSELAKLAVILYLAWFLDLKRRGHARALFAYHAGVLPPSAADGLPGSDVRPARRGISIAAVADRSRFRRFYRGGLDGE